MSGATITETIQLTHHDDAAALLECKGDVLASIQHFTDTIICVPGVESVSRLVNIIGPSDNVRRARQLIEELLEDIGADREIRRLSEPVKKQMSVPREALGVLIGKNGENVKAMRQETNTMIICPRRWEPNVIEIFGTPQNVLAAEEVIREFIEYALYLNQRKTTDQPAPPTTPPPGFRTTQREKVASMVDRARSSCGSRTPQRPHQRSARTTTSSVGVQADLEEQHRWTKAYESDDIISVAHFDEPLIDMNFTKQADEYFKEAIRRLLEDEDHLQSSTSSTPKSTTVSEADHNPSVRQRQVTDNTTTTDDSPTRSTPPGFVGYDTTPTEDSKCTSVGLEDGAESDVPAQTCATDERKRRKKKKKRGMLLNGKNFAENIEILMSFFPSDMRDHVFRAFSGIAIVFFAVLFYILATSIILLLAVVATGVALVVVYRRPWLNTFLAKACQAYVSARDHLLKTACNGTA